MSNELATINNEHQAVQAGFQDNQGFELVYRIANMMSKSGLVPKEFQNKPADCMIAINMANRIGVDPLQVMQNLYIVHNKPSFSSQFLIATFNTCGRFSALGYEFVGTEGQPNWGCRAYATDKATGDVKKGTLVTIQMAKDEKWHDKPGSKWKTMPQQMLMYRAAAFFIRAYAPEIAMGLHTREEIIDISPEPVKAMPSVDPIEQLASNALPASDEPATDTADIPPDVMDELAMLGGGSDED